MTCPNCGQEYESVRCPNCGRPSSNTANRIIAVVFAIFIVLPCGAFGACSAWAGIASVGTKGAEYAALLMFALASSSIVAIVLIGYTIRKLWRN